MSQPIPRNARRMTGPKLSVDPAPRLSGPKLSVDPIPSEISKGEQSRPRVRNAGGIAKAKTVNPVYNTY